MEQRTGKTNLRNIWIDLPTTRNPAQGDPKLQVCCTYSCSVQCPREDIPDFINGRGGVSEDSSPKKAVLPSPSLRSRHRCRRLRALCLLPRRRNSAITWGFFKVEPRPCSLTRLASCLDPTDMPDFILCSTLCPIPPHNSLQTIRGHAGQGALVMFAQHVPLSTSPLPFSPSLPYFQFFTAVSGQTADGRQ